LDELVEEAVSRGMVVVAAAGNTGHRILVPPASAPSAITVGGLNDQNHLDPRYRRLYWSSYGRGINEAQARDHRRPSGRCACVPNKDDNAALYSGGWPMPDMELGKLLGSNYVQTHLNKIMQATPSGNPFCHS
jgi:hypothetical protein